MSEYKGIEFLRNKLAQKRGRIDLRYRFYEMKHFAKDMEISTPPKLRGWMSSFGWCGKAVDSLADRLVLRGFENDTYGMSDIYLMNNLDVLADSAVLGALICACSFIYISQDDSGFPQMRAVDGRDATGVIDPITNMLTEGYAVLESDKMTGRPKTEVYLLPYESRLYEDGKHVSTFRHPAPYPLLVPVIYRPDAKRPFGHSRISRACMDYQNSAARTVKRSEIAAEFYSYPQKYILGVNDSQYDAITESKFKTYVGSIIAATTNYETGEKPTFGQLLQGSLSPHVEMLRILATQFSAATGLTVTDTGVVNDANPTSSDAILAQSQTLVSMAEQLNARNGASLRNIALMALAIANNTTIEKLTDTQKNIVAHFKNPAMPSVAVTADAAIKIASVRPEFAGTDIFLEMIGFGQADIRRVKAQEQRERGLQVLNEVAYEDNGQGVE